jgi:hypothetical protein
MANRKKMENAKLTVLYLDEWMRDELKRWAKAEGISMADFIRLALARRIGADRVAARRARKAGK